VIVIAQKYGQLGNRLFVFAHFIGCALEHGLTVSNPAFEEYADCFQVPRRDLFCRYPPRPSFFNGRKFRRWLYTLVWRLTNSLAYRRPNSRFWRVIRISEEEVCDLADPQFIASAREKLFTFVQGWEFRDEASLQKHARRIREILTPVDDLMFNVQQHVKRAREGVDVLVGVHIRQGDYKQFEGGKYFYESDEYARVMKTIEALFPKQRVGFLVCSNTRQPTEIFTPFTYLAGRGHFVEDMYSLAACDYIVGPPSTYTMWASFYGATPLYMLKELNEKLTLTSFKRHGPAL
jgi:hypothetical protein